ncbi:unnamed protein product [Cochlearia groenlandica]
MVVCEELQTRLGDVELFSTKEELLQEFYVKERDPQWQRLVQVKANYDAHQVFDEMSLKGYKLQQKKKKSLFPESWRFKFKVREEKKDWAYNKLGDMVYGWKFKTQMISILAMNQKLEEDFEMRLLGENSHTISLLSRASMRQRVSDLAYQFNVVMKFHLWHKWQSKNHVQNFTTRKVHSLEAEIIRLCTMD